MKNRQGNLTLPGFFRGTVCESWRRPGFDLQHLLNLRIQSASYFSLPCSSFLILELWNFPKSWPRENLQPLAPIRAKPLSPWLSTSYDIDKEWEGWGWRKSRLVSPSAHCFTSTLLRTRQKSHLLWNNPRKSPRHGWLKCPLQPSSVMILLFG